MLLADVVVLTGIETAETVVLERLETAENTQESVSGEMTRISFQKTCFQKTNLNAIGMQSEFLEWSVEIRPNRHANGGSQNKFLLVRT